MGLDADSDVLASGEVGISQRARSCLASFVSVVCVCSVVSLTCTRSDDAVTFVGECDRNDRVPRSDCRNQFARLSKHSERGELLLRRYATVPVNSSTFLGCLFSRQIQVKACPCRAGSSSEQNRHQRAESADSRLRTVALCHAVDRSQRKKLST